MPVPVPKKQPAHPVFKPSNLLHDGQHSQFQHLNGILPALPVGLPPSFGTREEWINSLPSWRRSKPRQSWGDDDLELAPADLDLALVKASNGVLALGQRHLFVSDFDAAAEADDEMSPTGLSQEAGANQMDVEHQSAALFAAQDHQDYERGAFTPVFEDESPLGQVYYHDSTTAGVITPFADFVDRAVSAALNPLPSVDTQCLPAERHPVKQVKDDAPQEVVTPTATAGYKKLAEPLSEWLANFIWRACTTDANSTAVFGPLKQYPAYPPSNLSLQIHSLLLSTLLQPSAVFLALWYIARLPVSFLPVNLRPEQDKEFRFRSTLLGDDTLDCEAQAPFRLVVIGCMLANKWLDDHTFSNKTWHTISNIPIRFLNRLESMALDIFDYDLSISSAVWSQWLAHLVSHHTFISSPSYPQPIGRPSASPQAIVRKAIDDILHEQAARSVLSERPEPVFLGVEERRKEKLNWDQAASVADTALSEIDLDENGPLRDEYLPRKRRSTTTKHLRGGSLLPPAQDENTDTQKPHQLDLEKILPPPAKWSPAADEPILRDRNRANGHYVAVQPPAPAVPVQFQVLRAYPPNQDPYSAGWSVPQQRIAMGYVFDVHMPTSVAQAEPVYTTPCPVMLPLNHSHSRSQSLCVYEQTQDMHHQRMRSYPQSAQFYPAGPHDLLAPAQSQWARASGDFGYHQTAPSFPPYCGMGVSTGYQSTWLQAA